MTSPPCRRACSLAHRCAGRLRHQGLVARTVSVKVRTSDFRTVTRARTLGAPTDVAREIYLVARELVAGVDLRGLAVRLVGVRAEGLEPRAEAVVQPTLEEAVVGTNAVRRRAEEAVDAVRGRFGVRSIAMGPARARSTTTPADVDLS